MHPVSLDVVPRGLIADDLVELAKVVVDVLDPSALLCHYVGSSAWVAHLPFVLELTHKTDFGRGGGNTKHVNGPVVLVSSDCYTHRVLRSSFHLSDWERSLLGDLFEDRENTRTPQLHVLLLSTVEWINKGHSIGVDVEHKSKFLLL